MSTHQILSGHPELEGLCLALADWNAEVRILQNGLAKREKPPGLNPAAVWKILRGA